MENEIQNNLKGCVYFFKHVGLSPIKIGYSTNTSPIGRFDQFKTYAPFGAELIGFIKTHNAKELETQLHQKFASMRLVGEWFEMTVPDAEKWIKFYSDIEDIQEMNNFQVAWAERNKTTDNTTTNIIGFEDAYSFYKKPLFNTKVVLNQIELISIFNCQKNILKEFMSENKCQYKVIRVGDILKKGYVLYKKADL